MKVKLQKVEAYFGYGPAGATDKNLTMLDIKEEYKKLGGVITPETEIEFDSFFPGKAYEKTALTDKMPQAYLCEGSGSAIIYNPEASPDVISISVYIDKTGHLPTGDHYNIFLQYEIAGKKDHTDKIPNRHLELDEGVVIKPFINKDEVKDKTATIK